MPHIEQTLDNQPFKNLRPYNYCQTIIASPFPNTPKTTFGVGKTTSYVEKIISDIIQTTSDLFSAITNL